MHATHENAIVGPVPGVVDDDWSAFSFPAQAIQYYIIAPIFVLEENLVKSVRSVYKVLE